MKFLKKYSWNHFRGVLQKCYHLILSHKESLNSADKELARNHLTQLSHAIENKDRNSASLKADQLETFCSTHFKKPWYKSLLELTVALLIALVVATFVRQMWFELYEIPTGSMRPTFKEQDHLAVSKAQFGVNIPLKTAHFYFDPDLVKRTGIVIFSGDNLPIIDSDTSYFGLFPYKKRYIKRLIGKPGDTLYFYGGKIFGFDAKGNEINELLDSPALQKIEHIPFISFFGNVDFPKQNEVIFSQMNKPIAKVRASPLGITGEIADGKSWIREDVTAAQKPHDAIKTLSDIWGLGNYGMTELLSLEELKKEIGNEATGSPEFPLYLLIRHHPSLQVNPSTLPRDMPLVGAYPQLEKSYIPLKQSDLDALMDNMYTMRFIVKDGQAKRYSLNKHPFGPDSPSIKSVADGTYEFYYGKAYKVMWGGFLQELEPDHPLYSRDPEHVQMLYNLGMVMDKAYSSPRKHPTLLPPRYAYFRGQDLYLLGTPILKKADPRLQKFLAKEEEKERISLKPYLAFKDYGAPLKDGKLNQEFIQAFGLKIPEKNYLVLGDNHAMSSDSRVFGFVPESNLQGVPEIVLWPNSRFTNQSIYPTFVMPRLIVWTIMGLIALAWFAVYRYKLRRPIDIHKI